MLRAMRAAPTIQRAGMLAMMPAARRLAPVPKKLASQAAMRKKKEPSAPTPLPNSMKNGRRMRVSQSAAMRLAPTMASQVSERPMPSGNIEKRASATRKVIRITGDSLVFFIFFGRIGRLRVCIFWGRMGWGRLCAGAICGLKTSINKNIISRINN